MARTTVPNELVAINAIQGTLIADNAVTAVHIATNAVSSTLIADNAVTTTHIAQNNVTNVSLASNAIGVIHIPDGLIDTTQLADDAVDSDEIAAGAIDTAHIADDQVTLAKMAGLARGKIIYGDSSGNPTALAVGTNGQALVSDGTDIAWGSGSKSTEEIQDIVGGMFTGNTETNVTVTYQDGDGTIDVVGSAVTRTILRILARAGSFIDCTVTDATIPITARSGTVTVRKVSLPVQVIPQITTR